MTAFCFLIQNPPHLSDAPCYRFRSSAFTNIPLVLSSDVTILIRGVRVYSLGGNGGVAEQSDVVTGLSLLTICHRQGGDDFVACPTRYTASCKTSLSNSGLLRFQEKINFYGRQGNRYRGGKATLLLQKDHNIQKSYCTKGELEQYPPPRRSCEKEEEEET